MESMFLCCLDPAIDVFRHVFKAFDQYPPDVKISIEDMRLDLEFFQMLFMGLPSSEEDWGLRCAAMMHVFRRTGEELAAEFEGAAEAEKMATWERMSCPLKDLILQCKPVVVKICIFLLNGSGSGSFTLKSTLFQFQGSLGDYAYQTASLMFSIRSNLWNLKRSMVLIAPVEQHFAFIEGKLDLFIAFVYIARDANMRSRSIELISHIQLWANQMSRLVCLYWTIKIDERLAETLGSVLFYLMQDYMIQPPEIIALHLDLAMSSRYKGLLQRLASYFDFLLQHMAVKSKKNDNVEILHEGLLFMLSFLVDTPNYKDLEDREPIVVEIVALMSELPSIIRLLDTQVCRYVYKIDMIKIKVRDLYIHTPLVPSYNSPWEEKGMQLLDSHLKDLHNMLTREVDYVPSVKHRLVLVKEELASLRSFIPALLHLKLEHKELQDIWNQIGNVAYFAAYVTDFCVSRRKTLWYGITCLPNLIEETTLIKSVIQEIVNDPMYTTLLRQATTTSISPNELNGIGLFIGFKSEACMIKNQLREGEEKLTFISILGMAGQGKTSLAKRIYNDPLIHYHFFEKVWCCVSKGCNPETLLVKIASQVGCNTDVKIEYLIEHISHSLKGKRYLIVLDDVWDADVLKAVRNSFPDNRNGSRILVTSRNHDVSLQTGGDGKDESLLITSTLRFFTDEENCKLIEARVFEHDICPPEFLRIQKQIAASCKGLPLAAALIASVLKSKGQVLELWEEVATNLISHLTSEGFMDVLWESYDQLPDYLKPCFLYFGSFPRGQNISATKLKLLWMAEGMVEDKGLHLAEQYLNALVSRSLVGVGERRSTGEIKSCKVHDLLHDLCLQKAVEVNIVHLIDGNTILGKCHSNSHQFEYQFQHRLCIHEAGSFTPSKCVCARKQLSASQVHSILWFDSFYSELRQPLFAFLSRFKVLTILDLEDMYLPVFPQELLHNIHLRYLALCGLIEHIPSLIADFSSMETLIVKRTSVSTVQLPQVFWAKESLIYVHVDRICVPLQNDKLFTAARSNLEVLSGIVLEIGLKTEEFLRRLTMLKKLKCYCSDEVLDLMWFSLFGSLKELKTLIVRNHHGKSRLMLSSHPLPALNFPGNLRKLVMEGFRLPWSFMSIVGRLPKLEVLKLRKWACIGTTWHFGDGEFSNLRYLELLDLDVERLDDSACETQPFPYLEKLFIIRCLGLGFISSRFEKLVLLNTIDVSGSPAALKALWRIIRIQIDNERNIEVLGLGDRYDYDQHDSCSDDDEENDDSNDSSNVDDYEYCSNEEE